MITLQPPIPSAPASLETLSNMLILLADPVAAKNRVAEMTAATAELQKAVADQKASIAAFTIAESDHRATLKQQATDAAEKLAAAQAKFDDECKRRSDELAAREANAAELQKAAADDAKAAAALRSDYDRRLKIIRSATG
jgi:hypothetical protein